MESLALAPFLSCLSCCPLILVPLWFLYLCRPLCLIVEIFIFTWSGWVQPWNKKAKYNNVHNLICCIKLFSLGQSNWEGSCHLHICAHQRISASYTVKNCPGHQNVHELYLDTFIHAYSLDYFSCIHLLKSPGKMFEKGEAHKKGLLSIPNKAHKSDFFTAIRTGVRGNF